MKRSISLLSALAFVLAFSGSVFGQASSNDITASADIVSSINYSNSQNLQFGQLSDNYTAGNPSISPSSNGSFSFTGTGTNAQGGTMTVETGGSPQNLTITIDSPATLDNSGSSSIDFGIDHIIVDGDGNNQTNITTDNGSANITTTDNGSSTYIANVYFGGSLDTQPTETGSHTGTITVNVDYQ